MAAASQVDNSNQKRGATSAQFLREVEEEGIKFNIENTAEDIINGLFCTYEPPTSRMDQYRAAKAVRNDPEKYAVRPSVPKSILKWKIKKNNPKPATAETKPEAEPETRTEEQVEAESSDEIIEEGEKKNVTWRDQKGEDERTEFENKIIDLSSKYCGNVCNGGEAIADIMSSPKGRDVQNFFATDAKTPGSMASKASALFGGALSPTSKKVLYDDQGNLIREDDVKEEENRSYFPSTPATGATTTPKAAEDSTETTVGGPNLFCSNIPFMDTMKEGIGIAGVMAASAAVAAGVPENLCNSYAKGNEDPSLRIYEPVSYDQPASSHKFNRQSTPRRMPFAATPRYLPMQTDLVSQQRKLQTPSNRSYATSDITMGNTTVKHFSGQPSPRTNFSSMMSELKQVQGARALNNNADTVSVSSKRSGYLKSPKSAVVTQSYIQSIKTPNNTGKVAEIARQLDAQAAIRQSIDPIESRQFDGKMNFLPPTPRRPATPSSTVNRTYNKFNWDAANKFGSTPRSNNTDIEIREAASSVFETRRPVVTQKKKKKSKAPSKESAYINVNSNSKKKKEKKKGFFSKMRKVTKQVESQRIAE